MASGTPPEQVLQQAEVDILGVDGVLYKGRMDSQDQTSMTDGEKERAGEARGMSGRGSVPGSARQPRGHAGRAHDDCLGDLLPATQLGCSWTPHGAKSQGTELMTERREG